jgi:predicted membrane protein
MEAMIEWFRLNPDVFGFIVATLIFLTVVVLVAFHRINLWMTVLFLFFALISGLIITNQHRLFTRSSQVEKTETD